MKNISIYDMDRTITRYGTFTPFLFFAAKRRPMRLALLPLYLLSLIGYPLKLMDRLRLKQLGFRLMVGRRVDATSLSDLANAYADHVCKTNMYARARDQINLDKSEGRVLVLATASPDFYAAEIGKRLGFDHVLGTVQTRADDGFYLAQISGANCYAHEKLRRIEEWLPAPRQDCHIRFYSDHHSDEPVLAWADEAVPANPNRKLQALAKARNWTIKSYA